MSDDENQRDDVEGEPSSPASPVVYVVQTDYDRIAVQRNHAVSRINGIINTMTNFQADRLALETRRDMLKECYKAYNLAQSTLEQWNPDESTSREEVEVYYVNGLTTFEKAIAAKTREETMGSTVNKDGVRLPAIDLHVFSGTELVGVVRQIQHANSPPRIVGRGTKVRVPETFSTWRGLGID